MRDRGEEVVKDVWWAEEWPQSNQVSSLEPIDVIWKKGPFADVIKLRILR